MAKRAYVVPLRSDLNGAGLYIYDLKPNGSLKNNSLDGVGQSHYIKHSFNAEADDQVISSAEGLVRGSATTDTLASVVNSDVVAPGGNDSFLTTTTEFGIKGYLRERVHVNPAVGNDNLIQAEVDLIYDDLVALVAGGSDITLAAVNTILVARAGAGTDLDGAGASSSSFGSVEDLMRMFSGEVYRTRANTIVSDNAGNFLSLADRETRVANSYFASPVYAQGAFLTADDVGYRATPQLALTEAVRLSAKGGVLYGMGLGHPSGGITFLSPSFTYAGGTPTSIRPLATVPFTKAAIAATGVAPACVVYDHEGNRIN